MKKIITMAVAALLSAASFAQETNENVLRIKTVDGETTSLMMNTVKDITFEEIKPLTMDIEVSNITQTSMDIDFPMPEGCSYWQMCIQKDEITGTDHEVRTAIQSKYNDQFKESKFLRIPNFEPGTTYYIYALMYDKDGVAAGIAKTSATTLAAEKNQFTINVKDITKTSATITFTPKDNNMTYYYFVVAEDRKQKMIEKYGDIQKADLEYLKYCAESANYDLDFFLGQVLATGTITKDARDIAQGNLTPNTNYYAYCYGMNTDGSFTTDVYEQEFSTEDITPSDNAITCEVVKAYADGCDVKATATNNDPYLIMAQPKAVWEKWLAQFNDDKNAAATDLIKTSYGGYADNYTVSGNYEGKVDAGSADTEYVLIVCGFDTGITTDVQIIPFKTIAE